MIRTIVIEEQRLVAEHLTSLLDETRHLEVIGAATDGSAALLLCTELQPDAVFVDAELPASKGGWLAAELAKLIHPPRLVLTSRNSDRAIDAFRLKAVDYLLKPLDPLQVTEAADRLATNLRPIDERTASAETTGTVSGSPCPEESGNDFLPVNAGNYDNIRLLSRREIVAVVRRERRTFIHTVLEEFATYYPLSDLMGWLGGAPFVQVGRQALVNLRAIESIGYRGGRAHNVTVHDRLGTRITASRTGAARLAMALKAEEKSSG
jgi:two-component system response regulator LytT